MHKSSALLLTAILFISTASEHAFADGWHGHGDIHNFHDHDFDHWRGGRWFNGPHAGRAGWWWIVDGLWYFYPAPIYPYPDPYIPPAVIAGAAPIAPAGAQTYYYCARPAGYYPYIVRCHTAWQAVISAPAAPPPQIIINASPQTAPAPQTVVPIGTSRERDFQHLNALAAKLQTIDLSDPRARTKLTALDKQVETFRQALFKRDYNAMGILSDAEDLRKRIKLQQEMLKQNGISASVPPPPTVGSPASLPPGSTVTFPSSPQ